MFSLLGFISIAQFCPDLGPNQILPCGVNTAVLSDSAYTNGKSGYEKEAEAFGDCFNTQDMKEGTSAFMEKRTAKFKGL